MKSPEVCIYNPSPKLLVKGFTPLEITNSNKMNKKIRKKCGQRKSLTGFTLLELIMVIGILALLIVVSLPPGINFYKVRALDVHLNGIVQTLRRAQISAMTAELDSPFGVYISSGNFYVLFKGDSYQNRDSEYDETFDLPNNLSITGLSEIIFSKLSGTPSQTGNIYLTIDNQSKTININEVGRINY